MTRTGTGRARWAAATVVVVLAALTEGALAAPAQADVPADTSAPVLTKITVPATLDTATGTTVQTTIAATDDSSGVKYVSADLTGQGGQHLTTNTTAAQPGTSVQVPVAFTVPRYNSAGAWTVSRVRLTDVAGNGVEVPDFQLPGSDTSRSVQVTAPSDHTPPKVTSLTVSPSTVNSTNGDVAVTVEVHATDAVSGVADNGSLVVSSPSGLQSQQIDLERNGGTDDNAVLRGAFTVPQYADRGTWKLGPLQLSDTARNTTTLSQAQLSAAGLPSSVPVTGRTDTMAPVLTALKTTPLDTTGQNTADDGAVTLTATDAQSGASSAEILFRSPSGHTTQPVYLSSDGSGTFTGNLALSKYAENGTWTVAAATVQDIYGNVRAYGYDQLARFDRSIAVTSTPDSTPPVLTGLTVPSSTVDVSTGRKIVTATVSVTDDLSGANYGTFTFTGPDNTSIKGYLNNFPFPARAGEVTATTDLVVPAYAPEGAYTLSSLTLSDAVGNSVTYPRTPFPASGVTTTLQVVDTKADITAPTLVGVTATPTTLDVRTAPKQLTLDVHLTDDVSGVRNGLITLTSPNGADVRYASFVAAARTSGTPNDGTYRVVLPFGTAVQSGTWTVGVTADDAAGNEKAHASAASVQVLGTATRPDAPSSVNYSVANRSAQLSWTPGSDGGATITGYRVVPYRNGVAQAAVLVKGAVSSTTVTGLTDGMSYAFTVAAVNKVGVGAASVRTPAQTPQAQGPGAPTSVRASAGNGRATVTWQPPKDDGGAPVSSYTVSLYTSTGSVLVDTATGVTGPSRTVTGLSNGTSYYFEVQAVNSVSAGEQTQDSPSVTPSAALPGVPTAVIAVAGNGRATVRWKAPAVTGGSPLGRYTVTSTPGGHTCTATTTSCVVTHLTNGTAYRFTVAARNAKGSSGQSARSAAVVPRKATALTITSAPKSVRHGAAARIVGRLTSGGKAVAGRTVRLQYRRTGAHAYVTYRSAARSTSEGVVTFTGFTPPYAVQVRLTTSTGGAYTASVSAPRTVLVTRSGSAVRAV